MALMHAVVENRAVDLSFVDNPARIAVYDDLMSSPRIIEVKPNDTRQFIGELASKVYESAKLLGGRIPFSIISQVAENFIHSYFTEVVVSILDDGNTIRFSDQGPGISDKCKALTPGFSSATAQMKEIIHGVGSGLPIVSEYMRSQNGHITIDDNMSSGAVVTITLNDLREAKPKDAADRSSGSLNVDARNSARARLHASASNGFSTSDDDDHAHARIILSQLSPRHQKILRMFAYEDVLSVTEISTELDIASSSAHYDLKKLEDLGIVTKLGKKRTLTEYGSEIIRDLIF